jgi:hypothetical protein
VVFSHFDVNHDGHKDLFALYRTQETGIALGDDEVCLNGETLDGTSFQGCDLITIVSKGCGLGFELVLTAPPLGRGATLSPTCASAARKAATVSGEARRARLSPAASHQAWNARTAAPYASRVAGASDAEMNSPTASRPAVPEGSWRLRDES